MRVTLLSALVLAGLAATADAKDMPGTEGDDFLNGTAEADRIQGQGGHDEILARGGDDVLDGGAGADQLDGRGGDDTLTGGPDRDLFLYYARVDNGDDTITDFDSDADTILLDGFTSAAVEVRTENGDTVLVLAGQGRIVLRGVTRLDEDDLAFR